MKVHIDYVIFTYKQLIQEIWTHSMSKIILSYKLTAPDNNHINGDYRVMKIWLTAGKMLQQILWRSRVWLS